MFAALLYILFVSATLVTIAALVIFWRNPPKWLPIKHENRSVGLLISMLLVVVIVYIVNDQFNTASRVTIKSQSTDKKAIVKVHKTVKNLPEVQQNYELSSDEKNYTQRVYKLLLDEYLGLKDDLQRLQIRSRQVTQLLELHPNSQLLLNDIKRLLNRGVQAHQHLQDIVSVQIKNAYIHATLQNVDSIDSQFKQTAKKLYQKLKKARSQVEDNERYKNQLLNQRLIQSYKRLLSKNDVKPNVYFDKATQKRLIKYRHQRELMLYGKANEKSSQPLPNLALSGFYKIIDIKIKAKKKVNQFHLFLIKNPNLAQSLKKTKILWKQLEIKANNYLLEILYILEGQYLAGILGVPAHQKNLIQLDKILNEQVFNYIKRLKYNMKQVENRLHLPILN